MNKNLKKNNIQFNINTNDSYQFLKCFKFFEGISNMIAFMKSS